MTSRFAPATWWLCRKNNLRFAGFPPHMSFQKEAVLELPNPSGAAVLSWQLGAGFYSSYWRPLPFAFGPVPPERYILMRASPARSPGNSRHFPCN
jgi:hypothetical protein